jgi:microcystin-dependent protein
MDEGTIGEIRLFAGNFAPLNWAFCNGQTFAINQYMALYSILGVQYGGDGKSNFQLPNLAPLKESDGGETPIQYVICLNGMYPQRS